MHGLLQWLIGKEFACNTGEAGDPDLIPGLGRSPGGGHGNPLQDSCLENPMGRAAWWATVHGVTESDTTEQLTLTCLHKADSLCYIAATDMVV